MVLLANSLTTPAIGTIFWTTLIFGLFFYDSGKICLETNPERC